MSNRKRRRHLNNSRPATPPKEVWISNSIKSKLPDPSFISPNQNFNWRETGEKTPETHSSKYSSKSALLPSTRFRSKSPQMPSRTCSKSPDMTLRSTRNGSKSPSTRYRSKSPQTPSGSTTDNFNSPQRLYSTRLKSAISPTSHSNSGKGNLISVVAPTNLTENVYKSPELRKRSKSLMSSPVSRPKSKAQNTPDSLEDCLINSSKLSKASRNRSKSPQTQFFCIRSASISPKTRTSVRSSSNNSSSRKSRTVSSHAEILQSDSIEPDEASNSLMKSFEEDPKKINFPRTGSSLAR